MCCCKWAEQSGVHQKTGFERTPSVSGCGFQSHNAVRSLSFPIFVYCPGSSRLIHAGPFAEQLYCRFTAVTPVLAL